MQLERTRYPRNPRQGRGRGVPRDPHEIGQKVRDRLTKRVGTIVDLARQYSHPKADPVFNYLIRWDDGQISAFSEDAFRGGAGIETID